MTASPALPQDSQRHLTTIDGWRRFVDGPPPPPPRLDDAQYDALGEAGRAAFDEARLDHHGRLLVVATSVVRHTVATGADLLYWRRKREQWRLLAEGAPDDATADYLTRYFEPTARAVDGLERALAGLSLFDDVLALDLRKPQDYFHRVWSTAFRAADLADAGCDEQDEYSDTCTADGDDPEQDAA
ncbi:hypothetical protein [Streptomyces shenzhenensis]|uniref:hypothetical protein n=1 Tax=Streptomyces shenzhenensis TaxID=943815 RepID=UPI0033C5E88D